RVYEAGDFSKNIYLIMENIFPAFSNKTKLATINYDIFQRTTGKDNLDVELKNLYQNDPALFFAKEESLAIDDDRVENLFTLAISLFKQKKYTEAIDVYQKIVERGTNSPITYFNILRNLVGLSGHFAENQIEKEAQSLITRMSPAKQRRFTRYPRLIRLIKFLGLKNVTKKILALLTNSPV
ncbi:MAG: CDC27 family protein, partial [Candidatus Paceibacterota bacterium]